MTAKTTEQKEAKEPKAKRTHRAFSAEEKCRAVLAVWTERRSPAAVCRELSVKWTQLGMWQNIALSAMLKALDTGRSTERPALGERLERLIARKSGGRPAAMLERRLDAIRAKKPAGQQESAQQ